MRYEDLSRSQIERLYSWSPSVKSRLNIVVDAHGNMTGADGSSNTLSNPHDRDLLKLVRAGADLVVVGSTSVKTEGWHIPPSGRLIVVTLGSFSDFPPCPHPDRVELLSYLQMRSAVDTSRSWLVEGGRMLISSLLQEGVIDELCISITLGDNAPETCTAIELPQWISDASPFDFTLVTAIEDESMLFTIWRRGKANNSHAAQ